MDGESDPGFGTSHGRSLGIGFGLGGRAHRGGQAEVFPQRGARILGRVRAALLQRRDQVVDDLVQAGGNEPGRAQFDLSADPETIGPLAFTKDLPPASR